MPVFFVFIFYIAWRATKKSFQKSSANAHQDPHSDDEAIELFAEHREDSEQQHPDENLPPDTMNMPPVLQALFAPRWKFWGHVIELVLILVAIIMTGVFMNTAPFYGRGDIMVIAMGAKSILFILYQILAERVARFQKWASLKANVVLNSIEIPFWLVVLILKFSSISTFCEGGSCALSIVIGLIAIVIFVIVVHVAVVSWLDWLHFRKHGVSRGAPVQGTPNYAETYYANTARK